MRKSPQLLSMLLTLSILLAACGSPQAAPAGSIPTAIPPTSVPPTTVPPTSLPPTGTPLAVPVTGAGAMVAMTTSATFGPILVDGQGMTLYVFEKDTANTSSCYGQCESNWPPLLTTDAPVAGDGVQASLLGTTGRTDGSMQVTYDGRPLYRYDRDKQPGDMAGQGVGNVWFVIAPDGSVLEQAPQSAAPLPAATQPSPYSY